MSLILGYTSVTGFYGMSWTGSKGDTGGRWEEVEGVDVVMTGRRDKKNFWSICKQYSGNMVKGGLIDVTVEGKEDVYKRMYRRRGTLDETG